MPLAATVPPVIDLHPEVRHKTTAVSPRDTAVSRLAPLAALLNNGSGKGTLG